MTQQTLIEKKDHIAAAVSFVSCVLLVATLAGPSIVHGEGGFGFDVALGPFVGRLSRGSSSETASLTESCAILDLVRATGIIAVIVAFGLMVVHVMQVLGKGLRVPSKAIVGGHVAVAACEALCVLFMVLFIVLSCGDVKRAGGSPGYGVFLTAIAACLQGFAVYVVWRGYAACGGYDSVA